MWELLIISTIIGLEEPKVTRYDTFEHFETCWHAAESLEVEFTQGEYTMCNNDPR